MATRFYLPSTGAAAVSPPFTHQASWGEVDNADRIRCVTTRISSSMTSKAEAKAGTAGLRQLTRQYVSDPIAAQTIAAGTLKGVIRCLESAANDNVDRVSIKVVVTSGDGATLRGTILSLGEYNVSLEFATSLTNRIVAVAQLTAEVVAQSGDRVVIEIGYTNTLSGSSVNASLNFGDNSSTDLSLNETGTAADNPFVELSQTISFLSPLSGSAVGSGLMAGAMSVAIALAGSMAGSGSAAAPLKVAIPIVGAATGSGSAAAAIRVNPALVGSAVGSGLMSGVATVNPALSGSSSGTGSSSGNLSVESGVIPLAGSMSGSGVSSGLMIVDPAMSGGASGSGSTSGSLDVSGGEVELSGSLSGSLSGDAILTSEGGDSPMSGGATGSGSMSAPLRVMTMDERLIAIEQGIESIQADAAALLAAVNVECSERAADVLRLASEAKTIASMIRR